MKKLIIILISCMIFAQLHGQQNPTTSNSLEQDTTTTTNIEVIQDAEGISENDTDETELTQESLPSEDMIIDSIPVAQIDTIQSPSYQEIEITTPSNDDSDGEGKKYEDNEGENIIVVLDDFQTVRPLQRKRTFLSFLSSLFKKKKRSSTDTINTTII